MLNNGITLVARKLETYRDRVTVTDYQIVNGCQTSHVLYYERDKLTDDVQVPLKMIATQDENVITSIVTATNRQTEVTKEDLYALGSFAKKLEEFLAAQDEKKRLYYERRSKQYNAIPGIEKVRIIGKWQQIRAFAAMFLDEAHRANGYSTELESQVGDRIFNEQHQLDPYYTAAFAHYRLEFLFRNGGIDVAYKPARYQLLMAVRYLIGGKDCPPLDSNRIKGYCARVCDTLWDNSLAVDAFRQGVAAVDATVGDARLARDLTKTRAFTDGVIGNLAI